MDGDLASTEDLAKLPRAALEKLLAEFADVMPEKLPAVDPNAPSPGGISHQIELSADAKPHASPLRRYSPLEDAEIKRVVAEQIRLGRMRESVSPWGAMVLLAKKKDGTMRFCVDYRMLNNATIKNRYALPLVDACFDACVGATVFSKLDLHSGFWQIKLDGASSSATAFRTAFGHYEYTVLPMGLCNAPGTFMHVMNSVFRAQLGKFLMVFLDDIFIYSRSVDEHIVHLREVLEVLRANHLYLKPSKCEWMKAEVEFLGHRVGREGLSVDPHKVDAVRNWKPPTNVTEVRSFLGLAGYYRRFLKDYSRVALPLTELTKDEAPWTWAAPQVAAFEQLKEMLSTAPVLKLADNSRPYVIHCDASGFAIGACLMQDFGEGLQPVSYISQKMNGAETRYAPHEQELMALVYACRTWRHYLHNGQQFTILSDHKSLRFFTTQPLLSNRQARWKDVLADFDFVIKYIEGPKNVVADALSRRSDHKTIDDALADPTGTTAQDFLIAIDAAAAPPGLTRDEFLYALAPAPLGDCEANAVQLQVQAKRKRKARRLTVRRAAKKKKPAGPAEPPKYWEPVPPLTAERQRAIEQATKLTPIARRDLAWDRNGEWNMGTQRCTASAKNGRQCGARTRYGQFCFAHRRIIWGTHIRPASTPGHGMALWSTKPLEVGDEIAGYGGDFVRGKLPPAGSAYYLDMRVRGGGTVDAARTNAGDGRFCNDPKGVFIGPERVAATPNCEFAAQSGMSVPHLRMTKAVPAGTELFVCYGPGYWAGKVREAKAAGAVAARLIRAQPVHAMELAAELSATTLIFGQFEMLAQMRAAAGLDAAYTALLTAPPEGQTVRDGLLWAGARLVVPADTALRLQLLGEMHDTPTGGHFGRDKTVAALSARFLWAGMSAQAAAYVAGCDMCQRVKYTQQRIPGLLMPLAVPEDIDSHWTMDHMTALPLTARGHDSIQGHFSRGGSLKRLTATDKTVDAVRAADLFLDSVVRHHGVPASVVSDRGAQFVSHFWTALMARLGTNLNMSTAYHAQTDGKSEREQRTLTTWLRAFCTEFPRDWDTLLPLAELALNCMPTASGGASPYQLLYGRDPALTVDRALAGDSAVSGRGPSNVPAAEARWQRMADAWQHVRGKLLQGQQRMQRNADRHRRDVRFTVGQPVLLSTAHLRVNDAEFNAKLAHLYCGPFPVRRVINANSYELELPAHMHIHAVVNITHLRAYVDGRAEFPGRPAAAGLSRPPPDTTDANGTHSYEVERVLAQKGHGANAQYLVLWKGYPYADASWEPASSLVGAQDALKQFSAASTSAGPARHGKRKAGAAPARSRSRKRQRTSSR